MKKNSYWNLFEKTGNIQDYLNYACTSEFKSVKADQQQESEDLQKFGAEIGKEGGNVDEPGNGNRNGSVGYANW